MPQRKQWRDLVLKNSAYENPDVVAAIPVGEISVRRYGT
jgi:hypothetical protein